MKIERMNKGSWGKVRAFFDVTTQEGFAIKGFKLIEGINGIFVSMPSQKGNDGEYRDTIWLDSKSLRDEVTNLAMDYYNNAVDTQTPESTGVINTPVSSITSVEGSTGNNLVEENTTGNDVTGETFKDEDIPF